MDCADAFYLKIVRSPQGPGLIMEIIGSRGPARLSDFGIYGLRDVGNRESVMRSISMVCMHKQPLPTCVVRGGGLYATILPSRSQRFRSAARRGRSEPYQHKFFNYTFIYNYMIYSQYVDSNELTCIVKVY